MARKLKSDNVLFMTTILLVALSLVMVYSASAPVALSRYGQASVFLVKQGMWAALGLPMLWLLMKVDYHTYREPVFIWSSLAFIGLALLAVLIGVPCTGGGLRAQTASRRRFDALAALAEAKMKEHGVPGGALGVLADGPETIRGLGTTNADAPLPVTAHTVLPIASTSHAFANTAMMRLVERPR